MKLSFVVPAYNEEVLIGKCIESIINDTKNLRADQKVEIIVVNNNCSDNTKSIALSYPGVIVVDEIKKGLTHARQAGFMASTGDLIANVDSDNMLPPGWTEKVFMEFEKNDRLIGLSGPAYFYDLSKFVNYYKSIFNNNLRS